MSKLLPPTTLSANPDNHVPKKIEELFDYQRAIAIQTAVHHYSLSSDQFLSLVTNGDLQSLTLESLEAFERVLPRPHEVQKIREAVIKQGCDSIEEGSKVLTFGKVE